VADLLSIYPVTVWAALLTAGIVIGLLARLLGVGGGIIAAPCCSRSSRQQAFPML
jgi:uncharacterized protein